MMLIAHPRMRDGHRAGWDEHKCKAEGCINRKLAFGAKYVKSKAGFRGVLDIRYLESSEIQMSPCTKSVLCRLGGNLEGDLFWTSSESNVEA